MTREDRPKRSWREIDQKKDRSIHRREEQAGNRSNRSGPGSQKSYRAALDKLFASGKIGDLVAEKIGDAATDNMALSGAAKLLEKIKKIVDRRELSQAIDSYLMQYPLPIDPEFLERMLEHRDPSRQREAMEQIEKILSEGEIKRKRAMIAQLKMIRDIGDDVDMMALAKRLIEKLD